MYEPEIPQLEAKAVPYGYAYGENCAEGFKINSIFSTDPSVYLNKDYSVGSFLKD